MHHFCQFRSKIRWWFVQKYIKNISINEKQYNYCHAFMFYNSKTLKTFFKLRWKSKNVMYIKQNIHISCDLVVKCDLYMSMRFTRVHQIERSDCFLGCDVWLHLWHVNNVLNSVSSHVLMLIVVTNEWRENSRFISWISCTSFLCQHATSVLICIKGM